MMAMTNRKLTGTVNYHAGVAAENQIAADYQKRGLDLAARRWRGSGGEIDLVFKDRATAEIVFVEVKKAKNFADAALRITSRQIARICTAAEEFLGTQPNGLLTPMRVDAAFVNQRGETHILENAITA
ncbi:MAG: YraN family protein [Pseudomonadota bacterium]